MLAIKAQTFCGLKQIILTATVLQGNQPVVKLLKYSNKQPQEFTIGMR